MVIALVVTAVALGLVGTPLVLFVKNNRALPPEQQFSLADVMPSTPLDPSLVEGIEQLHKLVP